MKQYKLLKDTPTAAAGTICGTTGAEEHIIIDPYGVEYDVAKIDNFNEWFEEIKEPTDSIHWRPKHGERIWYLDENGNTNFTYFDKDNPDHLRRIEFGNAYRTSQECEEARERRLAEVRLRQTSTFEPDFKNGKSGWTIYYSYLRRELCCDNVSGCDSGEIVRYKTLEDAKKSIRENREDWLTYFGVEGENNVSNKI